MLKDHLTQQISDAIGAVRFSDLVGVDGAVRVVIISGLTTIITPWHASRPNGEISTLACNAVANEILRLITLYHVEESMVNPVVGITFQISKRCAEIVIKLKLIFNGHQDNFVGADGVSWPNEWTTDEIPYYDFELEYGNNGTID